MCSLRWAEDSLHVTPALAYGASVARAMLLRSSPKQSPVARGLLRPDKNIRDGIGKSKCPPRNDMVIQEKAGRLSSPCFFYRGRF